MKKEKATRADLLERFAALKIPAARFEREHGLPAQMLAGMKQGKYASPEAAELVAKLEEAIVKVEAAKGFKVLGPATEGMPAAKNRVVKDAAVERELVAKINEADTPEKLLELERHVLVLRARDLVTDAFVRVVTDSVNRQRQLLKDKQEREDSARSGAPLEVRITYVNRWKGPSPA